MSTRYVFASEIRQALDRGDKVLELPVGARLSPQAADLIREYKLRVTFVEPQAQEPQGQRTGPRDGSGSGRRGQAQAQEPAPARQPAPGPASPASDEPVSEAQVEAIVQRVMARLAEARGEKPPAPPAPAAAPAATPPAASGPAPDDDLVICRCEEITKGQIRQAIRDGMATLNGVKRITRAGMGLCQGQTCARLVSGILTQELGLSPAEVEPTTARAPNRPVPMHIFAQA